MYVAQVPVSLKLLSWIYRGTPPAKSPAAVFDVRYLTVSLKYVCVQFWVLNRVGTPSWCLSPGWIRQKDSTGSKNKAREKTKKLEGVSRQR